MDTITQAALGACIAQAGFSSRLGRRSLIVGAVCGLLPDFDFLLSAGQDEFAYLLTHRGWSHSLLVLPFAALPVAWLSMKLAGQRKTAGGVPETPASQLWLWYQLCFLALITHPLLDMFTTFGTQILAPFSNKRFALDGVAIIDPAYTVPLLAAVLYCLIRPGNTRGHQRWARGALVLSSLYLGLGLFNGWQAKEAASRQLAAEQFDPVDLRAIPTLTNNIVWRIVAKDADGNFAVGFHSAIARTPIEFIPYESEQSSLVDQALSSEQGEILRWFSTGLLWPQVFETSDGGQDVVLTDMRFGVVTRPVTSFFGGVFSFEQNGSLAEARPLDGNRDGLDPALELKALWSMAWTGS
ncbi:metal-dependent hydrolase [Leisingera sp. ANG-Vp]|uniref:metal-dependent hydrolase n=1 Tax=Leisingera sp. ANG-Vp TaxID=1577896 RepID=UPI00068BB0AC|nr:metal-dependent hydrolase [Leisingera sp. ANG-Vp]